MTAIPLGRPLPSASCDRPERRREGPPGTSGSAPGGSSPGCLPLLLGLAPGGVFPAAAVAGGAVRSYRTVSPLPPAPARRCGLGGVLSVALSLGSPPPGVTRHRTSVEPGLSSPRNAAESGRPAVWRRQICAAAARLSKPRRRMPMSKGRPTASVRRPRATRSQGLVAMPTAAANRVLTFPPNSGLTRWVVLPAVASTAVAHAM